MLRAGRVALVNYPPQYPAALLLGALAAHAEPAPVLDHHADEDGIKASQNTDAVRTEPIPVVQWSAASRAWTRPASSRPTRRRRR